MKIRNFIALGISCSMVFSSAAYAAGIYNPAKTKYYTMTAYDTPDKVKPFVETQTQHTYGRSTTLGVSTSKTNTLEASGSVSYGVQSYYVSLSAQIGVSTSESETITTSQSWTIPETRGSGLYRVEAVFPVSKIQFNSFQVETGEKIGEECFTITYMPETDKSYKRIYRYANVG